jgi:phosphopantothenate-cysteine ligase
MSNSEQWTVQQFLADAPPFTAPGVQDRIRQFVAAHVGPTGHLARPLVCVTAGGTTVPLERNCVRFIDNFSKGTRGALSVEQFLEVGGCAELTLLRRFSLLFVNLARPFPWMGPSAVLPN